MARENLPFVNEDTPTLDVLDAMTHGRLGLAIVRRVLGWGIVTDGDIRRAIERHGDAVLRRTAADMMSIAPSTVRPGTRIEDALLLMQQQGIGALLVIDGREVVGVFKK